MWRDMGRSDFSLAAYIALGLILKVEGLCGPNQIEWYQKCVYIGIGAQDYFTAGVECHQKGGQLLQLDNEKRQLTKLTADLNGRNLSEFWLGGRKEQIWYWSDGNNLTATDYIKQRYWAVGHAGSSSSNRIFLAAKYNFSWVDGVASSSYEQLSFSALCSKDLPVDAGIVANSTFIVQHGQLCYFTPKDENLTWSDAASLCSSKNSILAKVVSRDVQKELMKLPPDHNYWTAGFTKGFTDIFWNGGDKISNDTSIWISSPSQSSSNPLCVYALYDGSRNLVLNAEDCNIAKKYLCEIEPLQTTTSQTTTTTAAAATTTSTTVAFATNTQQLPYNITARNNFGSSSTSNGNIASSSLYTLSPIKSLTQSQATYAHYSMAKSGHSGSTKAISNASPKGILLTPTKHALNSTLLVTATEGYITSFSRAVAGSSRSELGSTSAESDVNTNVPSSSVEPINSRTNDLPFIQKPEGIATVSVVCGTATVCGISVTSWIIYKKFFRVASSSIISKIQPV